MPRGLDHIVHAVRDLDAAAEFYRRAGFTVGARNRHEWGTHNHIVQFPGVFVELIAVGEPELIRVGAPGTFSFGAFMRDFLARERDWRCSCSKARARPTTRGVPQRRHRRFQGLRLRAGGQTSRWIAGQGCFLAGVRRRSEGAGHRLFHVPATPPGEFLESGVPEASERCGRDHPASSWSRKTRNRIATFSARFPALATSGRARMELPLRHPVARFKCSIPTPTGCMSEPSRPICRAVRGWRRFALRSRTKRA